MSSSVMQNPRRYSPSPVLHVSPFPDTDASNRILGLVVDAACAARPTRSAVEMPSGSRLGSGPPGGSLGPVRFGRIGRCECGQQQDTLVYRGETHPSPCARTLLITQRARGG